MTPVVFQLIAPRLSFNQQENIGFVSNAIRNLTNQQLPAPPMLERNISKVSYLETNNRAAQRRDSLTRCNGPPLKW